MKNRVSILLVYSYLPEAKEHNPNYWLESYGNFINNSFDRIAALQFEESF